MNRWLLWITTSLMGAELLLGCHTPPALAQELQSVATLTREARLPVRVQPGATADPVLQLWISSYTPPRRGNVEAVVSLASGSKEAELGRIVVFPSEPFVAASPRQERSYSFDARAVLAELRPEGDTLAVRVRLTPLDPTVQTLGGELNLSRAELRPRP